MFLLSSGLLTILGSALFKLYRDVLHAFSTASEGGVTVTASELETIRSDVNAIGKASMKIAEALINKWNNK